MTVPTPRRQAPGGERLSNGLALLALLALGIVWPGTEAARPPRTDARADARCAGNAVSATYAVRRPDAFR
jgi:hypothetical protein